MKKKVSEIGTEVEIQVPITMDTLKRIERVCGKFHCKPTRYIETLVDHDQHPYPQERLAAEDELRTGHITNIYHNHKKREDSEVEYVLVPRVTVSADTYEKIHRVCEKIQCEPWYYIEALIAHDQHPYPQERLAVDFDLMIMELASIDDDSDWFPVVE